jgi:hypothetical protein
VRQDLASRVQTLIEGGVAPVTLVDLQHRRTPESSTGGARRVAIAAALVIIVALVGVWVVQRDDSRTAVSTAPGSVNSVTVPLPARGQARAVALSDGSPAWLVRHNDGSVSAVSAVSTHAPAGLRQLVGWCAAGRNFEDGMYGSTFDERGIRIGGPAPHSLPLADTHRTGRNAVRVGLLHAAPETTNNAVPAGIQTCYSNNPSGRFDPGTTKLPDYFEDRPTPFEKVARQARRGTSPGVEYVRDAVLVVAPDNRTRLCRAAAFESKAICTDGPLVDGIDAASLPAQRSGQYQVIAGDMLLRPGRGSIELLSFTHGYAIAVVSPTN